MELNGKIKMIGPVKEYGSNGFKKREFVIETDEQYPQTILLELVQDKCEIVDKFKVGEWVTAHINIRGREWTNPEGETRYFNSINAWRLEANSTAAVNETPVQAETLDPQNDDLPF